MTGTARRLTSSSFKPVWVPAHYSPPPIRSGSPKPTAVLRSRNVRIDRAASDPFTIHEVAFRAAPTQHSPKSRRPRAHLPHPPQHRSAPANHPFQGSYPGSQRVACMNSILAKSSTVSGQLWGVEASGPTGGGVEACETEILKTCHAPSRQQTGDVLH